MDVGVTGCCCVLMRGNVHERIPDGLEDENQGLYERFAPTEVKDFDRNLISILIGSERSGPMLWRLKPIQEYVLS